MSESTIIRNDSPAERAKPKPLRTRISFAAIVVCFVGVVAVVARQHHQGNDYITFGTL